MVQLVRRLLVLPLLLAAACRGEPRPDPRRPSIVITTVPPAAAGGSERTSRIAGRVTGIARDHRVVLYARSGLWWVQPTTAQPFTTVQPDATWENITHLGSQYAALLVDAAFRPADTTESLPAVGGPVAAVAVVAGSGTYTDAQKVVAFSGYDWQVRQIPSDRGGQNEYDAANAWADDDGLLHLRLAKRDGTWTSAEVILSRSLGYGTYAFTVRDTSTLDPAAALGMITWDEEELDKNHRELDVEISRWGEPNAPNAQYVVQPYYVPANVARFSAPPGTLTHAFRWEPGRVSFRTTRGRNPMSGEVVAHREFTTGVPTPGNVRVRINLY
jgi:hypothetical protein